jgi:hypothetical protein
MELLEKMFDVVINPNLRKHTEEVEKIEKRGGDVMPYFFNLVNLCDALAFRSLPSGRISNGVFSEIEVMRKMNGVVIELPSSVISRGMTVEETIQYLTEIGQR